MSSLVWLLFGFTGFTAYETIKAKGIERIFWGMLAVLFGTYALALVNAIK